MAKKKKTKEPALVTTVEEPPVAYLTKRDLIRAINKGTRNLSAEALELMGSIVTVRDGWVVKIDAEGNVIQKITKLDPAKRPRKIDFD